MKTILSLIGAALFCVCTFTVNTYGQQLYTLTSTGGAYSGGTILSMNPDGTFEVVHDFQPPAGFLPMGNVVQASDGHCYGVCYEGGTYASCTIFSWDPVVRVYNDVYDFDIMNGDFPTSTPVEVGSGIIYGTATAGGLSGGGVIYTYDFVNDIYTPVYSFNSVPPYAYYPYGGLVLHSNGKLYGMTVYGGANNVGVIYSFVPGTNIYTEVYHFDSTSAASPYGDLVESGGILYGMTSAGGADGAGVVFSFDPSNNSYTVLHDFNWGDGANPFGTLIKGSDGMLYGTTSSGGAENAGVIFSIDPVSKNFSALHHFDITHGSMNALDMQYYFLRMRGGLRELNGILYGTAPAGGANNGGVIFSFDVAQSAYMVLLDLDNSIHGVCPDGAFVPIPQPNGVLSSFISGNEDQCLDGTESIPLTAHVRNGIGPFSFLWNTGDVTQSIDAAQIQGVEHFSVTVTDDGNGGSTVSNFQISRNMISGDISLTTEENTISVKYDTAGVEYFVDFGDGSPISTSLVHAYATNGTFLVTLTVINGCGSKTLTETANITGVFISPVNNLTFDVYPNPGNGNITISSGIFTQSALLQVSDLSGKVIHQEYLDTKSVNTTRAADLSQLPPGVYLLRLETETGSGIRKLVIE